MNCRIVITVVLLLLAAHGPLSAQDKIPGTGEAVEPVEEAAPPPKEKSKSLNVDMKAVYGQYNNMQSSINLSHEQEDYVYLLGTDFKRSNDFGYNDTIYTNTSFYENRIAGTGSINTNDTDKLLLDAEINNDSRGMYDNQVFSREEKDKAKLSAKYIWRHGGYEDYVTLGGAGYTHRLQSILPQDREKSTLNNITAEYGSEYIISASNRIRGSAHFSYYNYRDNAPDDRYLNSEIIDDFNLTKNVGISVGINIDVNKDCMPDTALESYRFLGPVVGVTLKGFSYTTVSFLYRYDVVPFKPEEFYLQQKYIMPSYDLPPGKVHHGDARIEVRVNDSVNLKGSLMVERNGRFYNYRPVYGNVLGSEPLPLLMYTSRFDSAFMLYEKILAITLGFEYNYFDASEKITYRPRQNLATSVQYNGKTWKVEWSNKLNGKVYIDPDTDRQLPGAVIGYFSIQRILLEGFYGYLKVENLYNNKYYLRDGYPEPGVTVLGGLRILI